MSKRSLTISWDKPKGRISEGRMSGRQYLEAVMAGKFPNSPISHLMGFKLVEIGDGSVVVECTPGEQHYNLVGNGTHGGFACTLLDTAMGAAVQASLPAGFAATTLELKVNMVRPITIESGRLRIEGRVVHPGRKVATSEGKILDASGKLYAHGTTTMMVFALEDK